MSKLQTSLMDSLSADLVAVNPITSPVSRWRIAVALTFLVGVAGAFVFGVRFNLSTQMTLLHFLIETVLLAVLSWGTLYSAFRTSMPGIPQQRFHFGLASAIIWFGLLVSRTSHFAVGPSWGCVKMILMLNVIPIVVGLLHFSRIRVFDKRRTVAYLAIGSSVVGGLALQFICPVDQGAHLLLWHGLSMLLSAFVVAAIGWVVIKEA
ncbi:MAG: NrsF family protein [bacterium]|nr:NrsF family protein [bacterium]